MIIYKKIFYSASINFFEFPYNNFVKWKVAISVALVVVILASLGFLIFLYDDMQYPMNYLDEINSASEKFGVDSELIASIINTESHFNEKAISNKGAIGLMQILPSTAEWILNKMSTQSDFQVEKLSKKELFDYEKSEGKLFDPSLNIQIGTFYISYLINKFKNVETALCAYNAGEGKVGEWLTSSEFSEDKIVLKKIPYRETEKYLEKINLLLKVYSKKFNNR